MKEIEAELQTRRVELIDRKALAENELTECRKTTERLQELVYNCDTLIEQYDRLIEAVRTEADAHSEGTQPIRLFNRVGD